MTWSSVGAQGSFDASTLTGASLFADDTRSNSTFRNASRFIATHPFASSLLSGGVDFVATLNSQAPAYFDSSSPVYLSIDSRF